MLGFLFKGYKNMKLVICSIFIFTFSFLFAVGEAGAIFLLIPPGAGAQGSGEAQVAKVNDAYSNYYNPAGLGFLRGREAAGMHVQWLPNLADDIYYEYMGYYQEYPGLGTIGGQLIFLNLGTQQNTDEDGNDLGTFGSWMGAIQGNFGTTISTNSSIGLGFKILHQKLAPSGAGAEKKEGSSTDFAFDIGYLKKYNKINFGLAVTNIGPPIWFKDKKQSDPAPTNMRMGIFAEIFNDGFNKVNILFDMNKLLVARYPAMDWDGDGIISGSKEEMHDDPWYLAVFTAWLDDWYFGGDLDINGDYQIGGFYWESDCRGGEGDCIYDTNSDGIPNVDYNSNDCGLDNICPGSSNYIEPDGDGTEGDGIEENFTPTSWATLDNGHDILYNDENYGMGIDSIAIWGEMVETPTEVPFDSEFYGIYNDGDVNDIVEIEKGTKNDRVFKNELKEIIYNFGLEYWYTDNFCLRAGYIHDYEGQIILNTFGAGIRLLEYGFDFGYTAGSDKHPRSDTFFYSINMKF